MLCAKRCKGPGLPRAWKSDREVLGIWNLDNIGKFSNCWPLHCQAGGKVVKDEEASKASPKAGNGINRP